MRAVSSSDPEWKRLLVVEGRTVPPAPEVVSIAALWTPDPPRRLPVVENVQSHDAADRSDRRSLASGAAEQQRPDAKLASRKTDDHRY